MSTKMVPVEGSSLVKVPCLTSFEDPEELFDVVEFAGDGMLGFVKDETDLGDILGLLGEAGGEADF